MKHTHAITITIMITHEVTMNFKATLVHNILKLKAELVAQHNGMEPMFVLK